MVTGKMSYKPKKIASAGPLLKTPCHGGGIHIGYTNDLVNVGYV